MTRILIHWTPKDIDLLRDNYEEYGPNIKQLLKSRTRSEISRKARSLGLRFNIPRPYKFSKWTKEEINILKKYYKSESIYGEHCKRLLKNRSIYAIHKKVSELKIRTNIRSKFDRVMAEEKAKKT